MTLLEVLSSRLLVFLLVLFSDCACPLSHSLSNGYLPCWKGLGFLTGEIVDSVSDGKIRKEKKNEPGSLLEKERAQLGKSNGKYIIGVGLPGDTDSPSHSSLTAVMEVKVWPQTVEGEKKELHVNICSQRLPGLKQIHYIL